MGSLLLPSHSRNMLEGKATAQDDPFTLRSFITTTLPLSLDLAWPLCTFGLSELCQPYSFCPKLQFVDPFHLWNLIMPSLPILPSCTLFTKTFSFILMPKHLNICTEFHPFNHSIIISLCCYTYTKTNTHQFFLHPTLAQRMQFLYSSPPPHILMTAVTYSKLISLMHMGKVGRIKV